MKRQESRERIAVLNEEFEALLDNPRAAEILTNEWLHDDTLPIPSVRLIELISVQLLHDPGSYRSIITAAEKGILEAMRSYVKECRECTSTIRKRLVGLSVARMHLFSFVYALDQNMLGWWLAKESFKMDGFEGTVLPIGKRRLARCTLEALTLRAFLLDDQPQVEGLSEVTRLNIGHRESHLTSSQLVARNMFIWLPFLNEKLGRAPSPTEMKGFLVTLYPNLTKSDTTWSEARRNYFQWDVRSRTRKIDQSQILKIARQAIKEGPYVKRIRSWRTPPESYRK